MKFNTLQTQGYFIKYKNKAEESDTLKHRFCGEHHIEGAVCPNCKKPLLLFFEFDMSDKRLSIDTKNNNFPLLFCWTCNVAQGIFYYKHLNDNKIKILKYRKNGVETDFPFLDYPAYFPLRHASLTEVTSNEQEIIKKVNSNSISKYDLKKEQRNICEIRHQIGGEPYLVQRELDNVHCVICDDVMPFVASVANNCADKRGFVGNDYIQIIFRYCRKCSVFAAQQQST